MKGGVATPPEVFQRLYALHHRFPAPPRYGHSMENCLQVELHLRGQPSERVVIDRVCLRDSGSNNLRPHDVRLKGSAQQAELDARPCAAIGQRGERVRTRFAEFVHEIAGPA